MDRLSEIVLTVITVVGGVAILALLVSPKATTAKVIQAAASGFANNIAVAQSPVTGNKVDIVTAYPDSSGFGGFNMPMNNY